MSRAELDTLRSVNYMDISGTYAALGDSFSHPARLICITNNTEGDLLFTTDVTLTTDQLFVAAGSFKLFDVQTNRNNHYETEYKFPIGTQFYVKQSTAPTSGDVYLEVLF